MKILIDNDNKVSSEQNAEGMYNVMIVQQDKRKFKTGYIFDSIELIGEKALLVCQKDSEGNKKFGLITAGAGLYTMYFPCIFDDVKLFLNTHPLDRMALEYYDKQKALRDKYMQEFVKKYGPISAYDVNVNNRWTWIDNPWPWETEAN